MYHDCICKWGCVYRFMYVIYVYVYIHIYIHMYIYTYVPMHIHVYIKGMEEIKTTVERKRICLSQECNPPW